MSQDEPEGDVDNSVGTLSKCQYCMKISKTIARNTKLWSLVVTLIAAVALSVQTSVFLHQFINNSLHPISEISSGHHDRQILGKTSGTKHHHHHHEMHNRHKKPDDPVLSEESEDSESSKHKEEDRHRKKRKHKERIHKHKKDLIQEDDDSLFLYDSDHQHK